jgi:hypothetical protein
MRTALAMSHQFDALLDRLPRATGSSRRTLRLDWPEFGFHVDDFAGKALVPGEKSLRGQRGINRRAVATGWSHANVEAIGDGGAAGPGIFRQVVAG